MSGFLLKKNIRLKNLIENETYTLHEETAPNGFVKATDVTFKVTDEKERSTHRANK